MDYRWCDLEWCLELCEMWIGLDGGIFENGDVTSSDEMEMHVYLKWQDFQQLMDLDWWSNKLRKRSMKIICGDYFFLIFL
jgi:hypothetical protein